MPQTIPNKSQRFTSGIRSDRYGYQVYAKVDGKQVTKRYPPDASVEEMLAFRDALRKPRRLRRVPSAKADMRGKVFVYFIRDGEYIKIGRTTNIKQRMSGLQGHNPRPLELLASVVALSSLEPTLHFKFRHLRIRREWFRAEPDLLAFIAAINSGADIRTLVTWADTVARFAGTSLESTT
jgi:hypothetical protein